MIFMKEALIEAQKAFDIGEVPIGAVLVDLKTNTIIARAHNETEITQNALNHAEKLCLERAMAKCGKKVLPETALFTTLEPCPLCATAISFARISKCYFAALDSKAGAIISHTQIHKTHPHFFKTAYEYIKDVYSEESEELLKSFFKNLRKK
ncbi:MAG: nucleoside deaminase [Alphaproteobacteria bacterium]|nr:nucleoside deaminase [Alphaproteobacteria bacterium]MBN2780135.1 nucleoside deaminase [Alphaproteobacteria bacterium]